MEPVVEDPVDDSEGSRANAAPRAPGWCAEADTGGRREISFCACSRRILDIPGVVSSSAGCWVPSRFTRPRLRMPRRRRPKWFFWTRRAESRKRVRATFLKKIIVGRYLFDAYSSDSPFSPGVVRTSHGRRVGQSCHYHVRYLCLTRLQ